MRERVTINDRGVVTIPAVLRRAFGVKGSEELIAEDTEEGNPAAAGGQRPD